MTRPTKRGTYKRTCPTCPWTGAYDTPAKANYAKRRHSCARHLGLAEKAARGAARTAAVDRTPKPCLHKEASHQHGTYACYGLDGCRCEPCAKAQREYETNRVRQQAYGRWDNLIDAGPARDHVRSLMDQGMGVKRICAVGGASTGQLWKLLYGKKKPNGPKTPSKRIRKDVAERLLAIELDLADGAVVDHVGTTRRIRALVALGWSQSKLAERLDIQRSNFHLARGDRAVRSGTARAVASLYEELSMQLPPNEEWRDKIAASRARRYSSARGWVPPLALDDDRLDDPTYRPDTVLVDETTADEADVDEVAIARRMDGDRSVRLNPTERAELFSIWTAAGRSLAECERVTGINVHRYKSNGQGAA